MDSQPDDMSADLAAAAELADRESRTTALGLLRYAEEYRLAAVTVHSSLGERAVVPYMLIAQSLELSLKAFLRSRGSTLDELQDLGHSLKKLHRLALRKRIHRLWPDCHLARPILRQLDAANRSQALRYIMTGTSQRPSWGLTAGAADVAVRALHDHCLRRTIGRNAAREMIRNRGRPVFQRLGSKKSEA